jgi:hypothetical protein
MYWNRSISAMRGGSYQCVGRHPARPTIVRNTTDDFIEEEFLRRHGDDPVYEMTYSDVSETAERIAEVEIDLQAATDALRSPGADIAALTQRITELHHERELYESERPEQKMRFTPTGEITVERWEHASLPERLGIVRSVLSFSVHPRCRDGGGFVVVELDKAAHDQQLREAVSGVFVGR